MTFHILQLIMALGLAMLAFGFTVFIHEMGHFLVALWSRFHVEVFSVGFPPKMFSKTWKGVVYQIGWVPLGGYVALPQLDVSSEVPKTSDGKELPHGAPGKKILVAFAGPLMNVILALILAAVLCVTGVPVPQGSKSTVVGLIPDISAEAQAGMQTNDVVLTVNGDAVGDFDEIRSMVLLASEPDITFGIERDGKPMEIFVTGEALRNNPRNYALVGKNKRWTLIDAQSTTEVNAVEPSWFREAMDVGFRRYDEIISIDGVDMEENPDKIREYIRSRPEQELTFVVKRGKPGDEEMVTLKGAPQYVDRDTLPIAWVVSIDGHQLEGQYGEISRYAEGRKGKPLSFTVRTPEEGVTEVLTGIPKKVSGGAIVMTQVMKEADGNPARYG